MNNRNDCDIYYLMFPDPATSVYVYIPFAFIYAIIFILGIVGNVAIIHVTLQHRTLQTVQNMFILNLAASDIIVCLLSLPITPVTNIFKNWYFGSVLCRLIPWVQGVSVFICTFSLGAIALDRYILVVHPHVRPLSKHGALIATAFLWTLSVIVTLPYAIYMYVESYQRIDARSSALEHSNISCELPRDSAYSSGLQEESDANIASLIEQHEKERQRLINQTRRTTIILVSMVVIFGLTWLPHNVVSLIIEYDEKQNFFQVFDMDFSYLVNLFTHSVAITNIVSNPVLYAWLNPTFRELVVQTCYKNKKRVKVPMHISTKNHSHECRVPTTNFEIRSSDTHKVQRTLADKPKAESCEPLKVADNDNHLPYKQVPLWRERGTNGSSQDEAHISNFHEGDTFL
uniref:G_PROTEIN_RECEP_F1_2 domain-containing protein n=1 Tax=Steinernema glaseri TaxID=37863 RepID=A0A1I7Z7X5_9BILA